MRKKPSLPCRLPKIRWYGSVAAKPPIVSIENATFYRSYPSPGKQDAASNPAIFPGLNFSLPASTKQQQHWAIIGPSNAGKTTFLEILRGQHLSIPPTARSFPYLSTEDVLSKDPSYRRPTRAIQYVGFDSERGGVGRSGTRGVYLGARYESRREDTDYSVMDFLKGNTDLNPSEGQQVKGLDDQSLEKVITDFKLEALVRMPMGNLSNGQIRRARIARALLGKPMVLLLDEPFMGLDPPTMATLSTLLHGLAQISLPRLVFAMRPQDPVPDWITHVIDLNANYRIAYQGENRGLLAKMGRLHTVGPSSDDADSENMFPQRGLAKTSTKTTTLTALQDVRLHIPQSREGLPLLDASPSKTSKEPLVEMQEVRIRYGDKEILGRWDHETGGEMKRGLAWTVRRGERWGLFGPNGSGKTTLLSLICSDHPQAYSLPIKLFGRGRLPQPGLPALSIFDIQARIGQSSPEIHAFFPGNLSIRQTIENAWADTFLGTPNLKYENGIDVETCLRWFEPELNPGFTPSTGSHTAKAWEPERRYHRDTYWADNIRFGDSPFSAQRVALLLRALVKKPELVVLDEAFSGMDDYVRDKCMLFLTWGETRTFGTAIAEGAKQRFVCDTPQPLLSQRVFGGLSDDQALICISHVKEEVPGLVREWLSLPESSSRKPARFGKFPGPLEVTEKGWEEVWNM